MVYLDNAATSFPKPESVYKAVDKAIREECGNPGRSGHKLALSAGRIISEARMLCARILSAPSPSDIAFASNTTAALNMALKGFLKSGDHVITTTMEHNSVIRPLNSIEGISITKLSMNLQDGLSIDDVKKALRPNTKLLVCTHVSNVTGTVNDIDTIGEFCRENGIIFLVDAAQSLGVRPVDVKYVDMLAFPGHKGLLAPQGTGGLYVREGIEINTIIEGGTGSNSELLYQPDTMPSKLESGTLNVPGLAGLSAGIRFILEQGVENILTKEIALTQMLIDGLKSIDGIRLIGAEQNNSGVVSVCFDRISPSEAALMMDASFDIAVRSGLHCAIDAHDYIGTLKSGGTLRISPNYFNTVDDIHKCLEALEICAKGF